MNECTPTNPCKNGGVCTNFVGLTSPDGNGYSCACGSGFSGVNCTTVVPTAAPTAATQPPSQDSSESSNKSGSTSNLLALWIVLGVVALAIIIFGVILVRRRRQQSATLPTTSKPSPRESASDGAGEATMNWEGIDDSVETSVALGTAVKLEGSPEAGGNEPDFSFTHRQLTISGRGTPGTMTLEANLHVLEEHLEANEYKQPIYRTSFNNIPSAKESATYNAAQLPENLPKNRYRNVLPYDDTRVRLLNGASDYVNASHVSVNAGNQQLWYVASQGPLDSTVADFWQMIWETQAQMVVMVSSEVEAGVQKCARYWPTKADSGETVVHGDYKILLARSTQNESYAIRGFKVTEMSSSKSRVVWQLQFFDWPDHGI